MSMRTRFILIIGSVLILSGLATWLATEYLIKSQYLKIENENIEKDTGRVVNAFGDKVDQLAQKTPDWSSWDDTYNFIEDKNEAYIESNLTSESLQSLGVNFMLFYNSKGELIFSKGVDIKTGEDLEVPKEFLSALSTEGIILAKDDEHQLKGVFDASPDPLLISARPILNSDFQGPFKGTLIFAEYMTGEDIKQLSELTKLDISVERAIDENSQIKSEVAQYSSTEPYVSAIDSENIVGRQLINDIYTKPSILVSVREPRAIVKESQKTLVFYMLVVIGFSAVATITVLVVTRRVVEQTKTLEIERASKQEIEKQVVDRTRQAEEEQARLRSAMDGLEAGLLITFNDRQRVLYNPALVNILGLQDLAKKSNQSLSEVTLEKIAETIEPNTNIQLVQKISNCLEDGKTFQFKEIQYRDKVLSIFGAPIILSLDKIIGTVILVEDITEAKVVERSKDEFFSIASHELRTPLTAIKGNSSMILEYFKDKLKDDELSEMLSDIHESSVRLIEIVSDFLDVSRLEQGKMKFNYEPVSIIEVIDSVAKDIQTTLNTGVDLEIDGSSIKEVPAVRADKNKLKQVVYNLIGNSVKFTDKGKIKVTAFNDANTVEIRISDTGRGIAPELKGLLFHKFQQANQSLLTRDTTKGTGLGLYISKMIIENMGGSIRVVESEVGKGTTFGFTVPINKPSTKD